jgi:uncharacterized protein YjiS (DUF1127 family)
MIFSKTYSATCCSRRQSLGTRILSLLALHRQRRSLGKLDARLLADVGLSQTEANTEMERPLWDVPPNWRLQSGGDPVVIRRRSAAPED